MRLLECLLFALAAAGYYRRKKNLSSLEMYLTSWADLEQLYYRRTTTTDKVNGSKKHEHPTQQIIYCIFQGVCVNSKLKVY